jgi:glutamate synthase domain-containing protein 3
VVEHWESALAPFVKVMPHDYKRALAELEHSLPESVSSGGEGFVITESEAPAAA